MVISLLRTLALPFHRKRYEKTEADINGDGIGEHECARLDGCALASG